MAATLPCLVRRKLTRPVCRFAGFSVRKRQECLKPDHLHPAEWSKVYQVRAAPARVFNADNARVCARYSDGQQGITRAAASTAILAPSRARTASSLVYSSVGMKSTSP